MTSKDRWFTGPEFLLGDSSVWPRQRALERAQVKEYDDLESQKQFVHAISINSPEVPTAVKLMGWAGLLAFADRVGTRLRRWMNRSRRKRENRELKTGDCVNRRENQPDKRSMRESPTDGEKFWYREIQAACFPYELRALKDGRVDLKRSKLRGLKPYMDAEGLMRAEGRVSRVKDCVFENRPIILDAAHFATKLLIASYHQKYKHANNETVVNELRQEFYIVGLRARLRWIAKRCIVCRRERAKPLNPPMADLPISRVAYQLRPFTHCRLDYFGPMFVKIGRRREKRWGVIFTCMTTRAIHLELAHTLDASSTISALRRLGSTRGPPAVVYSDNGTNFTKASRELRDAVLEMDKDKQLDFAKTEKFTWRFNPPGAPHMGERGRD